LGHPDAKLTDTQRKQLVDYFRMIQKEIQEKSTL